MPFDPDLLANMSFFLLSPALGERCPASPWAPHALLEGVSLPGKWAPVGRRRYYVIVAWIWSLMFYLGLDPLKWAMAWAVRKSGLHRLASATPASSKVGAQACLCAAETCHQKDPPAADLYHASAVLVLARVDVAHLHTYTGTARDCCYACPHEMQNPAWLTLLVWPQQAVMTCAVWGLNRRAQVRARRRPCRP